MFVLVQFDRVRGFLEEPRRLFVQMVINGNCCPNKIRQQIVQMLQIAQNKRATGN